MQKGGEAKGAVSVKDHGAKEESDCCAENPLLPFSGNECVFVWEGGTVSITRGGTTGPD